MSINYEAAMKTMQDNVNAGLKNMAIIGDQLSSPILQHVLKELIKLGDTYGGKLTNTLDANSKNIEFVLEMPFAESLSSGEQFNAMMEPFQKNIFKSKFIPNKLGGALAIAYKLEQEVLLLVALKFTVA